jgi:dTDP-4-dehydrorhamnose reductase
MKILLLGSTGQLGWELHRTLPTLGQLIALDYPQIDMANPDQIREIVSQIKPHLIINATAYTNVDQAEENPKLAMAINGVGPGILAEEAYLHNAALIHYSTDYVFNGTSRTAYSEEDNPNPINVYGRTKLEGEKAVQSAGGAYQIYRTSWVYSSRRPCFLTSVIHWASKNETLHIVDDQISSPTWARTLAEATAQIISQGQTSIVDFIKENQGIYHLSGGGYCSRFDWTKEIINLAANKYNLLTKEIKPVSSDFFKTKAKRPNRSVLSCKKINRIFGINTPDWRDTLKLMIDD